MSRNKEEQLSTNSQFTIDSVWIKRISNSDAEAFEKLFNIYCQPLINFVNRFLNDIPASENAVQDVFVKIWENRRNLNPGENFKTYLFTAARNTALKYLRHTEVKRRHADTFQKTGTVSKTPEEEINEKEISTAVQQAVEQLPDKGRTIFSMNRYDGMTYQEIADVLNISVKTVETHMGRSLKFLRYKLIHLLSVFIAK